MKFLLGGALLGAAQIASAQTCGTQNTRCYLTSRYNNVNPWEESCCANYQCQGGIWWATCQPKNDSQKPPNPKAINYVPLSQAGTAHDSCPEAMNLGPELSASTNFEGDFPKLYHVPGNAPRGRDNALSVFVGGDYTIKQASEVEGRTYIGGDLKFVAGWGADNFCCIGHVGIGSGTVSYTHLTLPTKA